MKVDGRESADYKFELPTNGDHVIQFMEGIEVTEVEEEGKEKRRTIRFPAQCAEGDDSEGVQVSIFAGIGTKFGKQKIADIVVMAGMKEMVEKQFPDDDVEIDDKKVVNFLKVKLPGRKIGISGEAQKYKDKAGVEKDSFNITHMEAVKKGGKSGASGDGKTDAKSKGKGGGAEESSGW